MARQSKKQWVKGSGIVSDTEGFCPSVSYLGMAVDDTVDALVSLVDLGVDETFQIACWSIGIYWAGVGDVVLCEVFLAGNESWSDILAKKESLGVLRVANLPAQAKGNQHKGSVNIVT